MIFVKISVWRWFTWMQKNKNRINSSKMSHFKGNLYHFSQVNFAYNSNKIEGSKLTEDQTEAIFDTHSFIPKTDDLIKLDDLLEVKNHLNYLIIC